jgi:hypothetical protein
MPDFYTVEELPKLTPKGFEVKDLPPKIYNLLQEYYQLLMPLEEVEYGMEL